ncbi:GlsB/YeaQ/YmgE family stress response membrane protein [Kocuria sp.]|uniref:GlsB/YeaQ/YmgE family stress response membrane protein n=1 Tax=Kocuria sp. TaxID=1871328 RepID=UPI0026E087B3|nr:GlsB/YeaQ/YmgE family stress response membrane protein [Kocuria sp.]MDO5618793.1 GlsB/YeaQ/YmgE family stress response membrane protein [Kocuria sp.]
MLAIIGWIILGLIAGALAKLIMPGNQGGGIIVTMLLGIVGAVVGGFLFSAVTGQTIGESGIIMSLVIATVGALVVLFVWGLLTGRRGAGR